MITTWNNLEVGLRTVKLSDLQTPWLHPERVRLEKDDTLHIVTRPDGKMSHGEQTRCR